MRHPDFDAFQQDQPGRLAKGPIAVVAIEDEVEVASTLGRLMGQGFKAVLAFCASDIDVPTESLQGDTSRLHVIDFDSRAPTALTDALNLVAAAAPGNWIFGCYNAEYLFYPFSEHRTVGEMTIFCDEEHRRSIMTYVIDLYAADLSLHPDAVDLRTACLDGSGYYALARKDTEGTNRDRQLDFFGGLRWRFEEHIPVTSRRIDRISLFRADNGVKVRPDYTLSDEEMNTYACAWHNNVTAALVSFRTAKALKSNPGSTFDIDGFRWRNSVEFDWSSQQLLDLGLMETGQWF